MFHEITIQGFKSLEKVHLELSTLNLFVGTNASGKSNFLDALRLLQGIGYGFTVEEILNGKPKGVTSEVWEPIRGGSARAAFSPGRNGNPSEDSLISFTIKLSSPLDPGTRLEYSVSLSPVLRCIRSEKLMSDGKPVFDSGPIANAPDRPVFEVVYYHKKRGTQPHLEFDRSRPVLGQILHHGDCLPEHRKAVEACLHGLSNTQKIDPSPAELRKYSTAQSVKRMGERGENFAALVSAIITDEGSRKAYVSWLKQLDPVELDDVSIMRGALEEPLFALRERGRDLPAPILSDGTLRFSAISAAFFQPDIPDVLTIEEIENGIHPSRLRLLVELLRSQPAREGRQVIATTHSPIVLAWLKEEDYQYTFFCKRDESRGASIISPLNEVPNFMEIVRKQPIGDLFAEGWLEGAL